MKSAVYPPGASKRHNNTVRASVFALSVPSRRAVGRWLRLPVGGFGGIGLVNRCPILTSRAGEE